MSFFGDAVAYLQRADRVQLANVDLASVSLPERTAKGTSKEGGSCSEDCFVARNALVTKDERAICRGGG